jgi:probable blue pigment (indigoidine) exporter
VALVATTALAPIAWGTTYLVTTELLPPDRPLLAGALRALPAGLALAAMARVLPTGTWWLKATVLGTLNVGAFFALLFVAAYRLPGGVAATLGAIQPLVAAGLAAGLLREPLRRVILAAGLLGIAGVALLVLRADARLDAVGVAAGLAATLCMATGVVLTKHWGRPVGLVGFTSWQLVAGGLVLAPLALAVEGMPPSLTLVNVAGYAWLTSVGAAIAFCLWFRGVQSLPVAQVSLLGLLSPVVAAIAGLAVLGQTLSPGQLAGMAMILVAVSLGQAERGCERAGRLRLKPRTTAAWPALLAGRLRAGRAHGPARVAAAATSRGPSYGGGRPPRALQACAAARSAHRGGTAPARAKA